TSSTKFESMRPAPTQDGWRTDTAENVGLSVPRLKMMEQSIRKGDFKNITSVLIARNGALSYEAYFDNGGVDAFRNTRSATKTVTGMLIGLAIDKGFLSTVTTPVLRLFPVTRQLQTPDPRYT